MRTKRMMRLKKKRFEKKRIGHIGWKVDEEDRGGVEWSGVK